MRVDIKKSKLKGSINAPYSKSYAHRMLILAALSNGESRIEGISDSEDMLATIDCIRALGAEVLTDGDTALIKGKSRGRILDECIFPCRESGSTLRFMIPLSLMYCKKAVFTGTERLFSRGLGVYEELFEKNSVLLNKIPSGVEISGCLKAGYYEIRGDISSQFVTGLLFLLPMFGEDSRLKVTEPVESRPYIDITLDILEKFRVSIQESGNNEFYIKGGRDYAAGDFRVEGDWSNAAFLYALKELGNEIEIKGLNPWSIQGDRVCKGHFKTLLREDAVIDISDCPDLGPVLFAFAAANKGALFKGTKRLRIKESDRALSMGEELIKFGIKSEIGENTVRIIPGRLKAPTEILEGHNDHRIVMALSVLCSITGGRINGIEAVRKSYPDFFERLKDLGLEAEYEAYQ
ncbi:MAG: 3-phosphoshikimate 1-carboxyvinyltransferase [Lachnospiraceae bacterium]|nr:3-phosphoshikimate 1-carboxyvinyltransferase [Lachnospiraceae bacterium]